MPNIACPKCRGPMAFEPSLAGKAVACPHCSFQFMMPGAATGVHVSPPAAPTITQPLGFSAAAAARFKPSTSLLDAFFDFRFERYVTPRIIRFTWMIAVTLCLFGAAWALYDAAMVWIPTSRSTSDAVSLKFDADRLETTLPSLTRLKLIQSTFYLLSAVAIMLMLLWIRVCMESMIVIFHIAESLQSIDRKTKG